MAFKILLFHHEADCREAAKFRAELGRTIPKEYELWSGADITAFGSIFQQEHDQVAQARGVIVLFGKNGLDDKFVNFTQSNINYQQASRGRDFGTIRMPLDPDAPVPSGLEGWAPVAAYGDYREAARTAARMLGIEIRRAGEIRLDAAKAVLDAEGGNSLLDPLELFTEAIAAKGQVAIFIGPHAHVSTAGDPSCPSRLRIALANLIKDTELHKTLTGGALAGEELPPLLWQDHLATLCLDERVVDEKIDAIVRQSPGDAQGPPSEFFAAIGKLARNLIDYHGRSRDEAGVPALTLISLCPGLRIERALVAAGVSFQRIALRFGRDGQATIDDRLYEPTDEQSENARVGDSEQRFIPVDADAPKTWHGIRLIKLGGSRDLEGRMPSDVAKVAILLSLGAKLDPLLVGSVGGAYAALGGGLMTPLAQGIHAALLRKPLEGRVRRPRYAIVPPVGSSCDPLANAEARQLAPLKTVPGRGFEDLDLVIGKPQTFVAALGAALEQNDGP